MRRRILHEEQMDDGWVAVEVWLPDMVGLLASDLHQLSVGQSAKTRAYGLVPDPSQI
jgi:hypothetical protein